MAVRPVFVPQREGTSLVSEVLVEFKWNPGMSPLQKKKNVEALHVAAKSRGLGSLLEISSKSNTEVGRRLSAFSLRMELDESLIYLECVYQGSKVFREGGPYKDLFFRSPKEAKQDGRLGRSGQLISFEFKGRQFPLNPKNAFYDWLYINTLCSHKMWIQKHARYDGYTDIEFNPERSINCQARAFAELIALAERGQLERAATDYEYFVGLLSPL
jgi:hypothetical protein